MVKSYYDHFKSFLKRAAGSISVAFICLTGVMGFNMDAITVHADTATPTAKQSFITWLMSYFGINIYTEAEAISETLYSAVEVAYNTYQLSLQSNQQVPFDKLFDGIELTPSQPNTLRLAGWVYNALSGFRNYILSTTVSEEVDGYTGNAFGNYETVTTSSYKLIPAGNTYIYTRNSYMVMYFGTDVECRAVFLPTRNSNMPRVVFVLSSQDANISTNYRSNGLVNSSSPSHSVKWSYNQKTVDNVVYGLIYDNVYADSTEYLAPDIPFIDIPYVDENTLYNNAIYYTYGAGSMEGETTLNDVFALPQQAVLDDLIGAVDNNDEVQLDLDDSDINVSILSTLQDLIDQVNSLTDTYVLDNSYPDTAAKIISQGVAIDNELTEVDYPNALTWEVPELINTPQIIPLITPDCPDLSACLVNGIQDVGQALGNVIESNANVSNYVSVILFMGIALTILGGI